MTRTTGTGTIGNGEFAAVRAPLPDRFGDSKAASHAVRGWSDRSDNRQVPDIVHTETRTHRVMRAVRLILSWGLALLTLPGCSVLSASAPTPASTAALVITTRMGATALVGQDGTAGAYVKDELLPTMAAVPGTLTVIRADGDPKVVASIRRTVDTSSSMTQQDSISANTVALRRALSATTATNGQADVISALDLAGDAVRGKPNPTITVVDSGLPTAGQVLFQTGVLTDSMDPSALAALVSIGRLDGVHVTWRGLCGVSSPQQACPPSIKQKLRAFFGFLIARNGGAVTFEDAPIQGEIDPGPLPTVDVVPFTTRQITGATTAQPVTIVLNEDRLRFLPNSNDYADPLAAEVVLLQMATQLKAETYASATVTGCTADDRPRSSEVAMERRGQGRADRVTADLRRLGATTALVPKTLGYRCPGFIPGADSKNRKVIISTTNS